MFVFCLLTVFLVPPALTDFAVTRLSLRWVAVSCAVFTVIRIHSGAGAVSILAGIAPGAVLMLAALTGRGIAWGDALAVTAVGCLTGWESCLVILFVGSAVCAAWMLVRRKRQAPFLPGLLFAVWAVGMVQIMGEKGYLTL